MREALPQSRAERLIAGSRLVLAIASLVAIYVDPLEPSRHVAATYSLLAVYTLYAATLALWNSVASGYDARLPLLTHSIDLIFFTIINYLTEGPTSPFFVYFVFSVICAILRFGRRGTIMTVVAAVTVFFASAVYSVQFGVGINEINRFIIRAVYLGVVGSLLAYLAAYQQRATRELSRIATWPRPPWKSRDELVRQLLDQAMTILGARRILLAYEDDGVQSAYLGTLTENGVESEEEEEAVATALLGPSADSSLVTSSVSKSASTFIRSGRHLVRAVTPPLHDQLIERFQIQSMVSVSFRGEFVRGRLLFLDRAEALQEDLTLGKIVAEIVGSRLDHLHTIQKLQRGVVAEERVRLGRNLHDSVLQSLTGAALQLQTLPRLMTRDPSEATRRISEVQQIIASDQRELRWFIDQLHNDPSSANGVALYDLENRLESLRQRFEHHWNMSVRVAVDPTVHVAPNVVQFEVYSIVSEAVANAAKHAQATEVTVKVQLTSDFVEIRVTDNGKGFPFSGKHTLRDLMAASRGPVTLKERVASLRGDMVIDTSSSGSRIDVRVPVSV